MSTVPQLTPAQLAADVTGALVPDVRLGELDRTSPIVTVCQSGRRSRRAAEALAAAGFTVANLDGGMDAWLSAGQPTA